MAEVSLAKYVHAQEVGDDATLRIIETGKQIPFPMNRHFTISAAVEGKVRGKHAHHLTHQVMFCERGQVKIVLDDAVRQEEVVLGKDRTRGIYLYPDIWHEMHDMNPETLLIVVASDQYNPKDYIRNYQDFREVQYWKAIRNLNFTRAAAILRSSHHRQ